ncbi:hypothetical protein MCEMSHM24_03155 [Comamonadaceae bacterium]
MDTVAIKQVWERLHKAKAALDAMTSSRTLGQIEVGWSDFLTAASTIFSKLERGSKGHSKTEPWFGRIKNERRTDPLLSYVHHARNADEHGIAPITDKRNGYLAIKGDVHIEHLSIDGRGNIQLGRVTGLNSARPPEIIFEPARIELLPVLDDRFGDTFDVPTSHMGKPLENPSAIIVAGLAYVYLEKIVREASALVKDQK